MLSWISKRRPFKMSSTKVSPAVNPLAAVQAWMHATLTPEMPPAEKVAVLEKKMADMAWRALQESTTEKPRQPAAADAWEVPCHPSQVPGYTEPAPPVFSPPSGARPSASAEVTELRVSNLAPETTEGDVRAVFQRYGTVESVSIATHRETGESLGHGFVKFTRRSDAQTALNNLHNYRLHYMVWRVEWREVLAPIALPAAAGGGAGDDGRGCSRDCAFGCLCWHYDHEDREDDHEDRYSERSMETPRSYSDYDDGVLRCAVCGEDREFSGWGPVCSRSCHRVMIGLDTP
jgi:RNA recognition motif. (a.k.a. RRM, RBD, or RNP domain)